METVISKYEILRQLDEDLKLNIKLVYIFSNEEVLLVTKDDKTYAFGNTQFGRLGLSYDKYLESPTLVEKLCDKGITHFAYGRNHVLSLTNDRKIYCWGFNRFGQLGDGDMNYDFNEPKLLSLVSNENFVDIKCGSGHSLALTETGCLYAWGWNGWGQVGIGNDNNQSGPVKITGFDGEKVIAISCGSEHSMALTESGQFFSWGRNSSGQLGFEYNEGILIKLSIIKKRIEMLSEPKVLKVKENGKNISFEKISCGLNHSLLLSNSGDIYAFGSNSCGQVGNNSCQVQYIPIKLDFQIKFVDIASHPKHDISVALSVNGDYYVWGKCGDETIRTPKQVDIKSFNDIFAYFLQTTHKPIHVCSDCDEKPKVFDSKQNGKYKKEFNEFKLIGSGSFGLVFKARSIEEDKIYAIKKVAFNEELSNKVFTELEVMSKLNSGYVIRFKNAWSEDKEEGAIDVNQLHSDGSSNLSHSILDPNNRFLLYIQMELCFSTLKEVYRRVNEELNQQQRDLLTPIGYYIASQLSIEILESVDYLHKQVPSIIHRDLKPNNVMITDGSNGRFCKIADFGLSTFHKFDDESHSKAKGTYSYMAPEVLSSRKYDTKADVYSMGIILKELFNLHKDIDSKSGSKFLIKYSKLNDIVNQMVDIKTRHRPSCDEILNSKCDWALSLNDIENEIQLKKVMEKIKCEVEIEKSFMLFFIQKKLKNSGKM